MVKTILLLIFALVVSAEAGERVGPVYIYPNPILTPGVANPDITQENIGKTICNKKWSTRSIRPPASYTNKLKRQQIKQYGYTDKTPAHFEEDHVISLELGGHPTDPRNLFPESYLTKVNGKIVGAKQKDVIENALHKQVCQGMITLKEAQRRISEDWYKEYLKERP
jgi:hypothetical protein